MFIIIFMLFHCSNIECCWLIYIEGKSLEWTNSLLSWFNNVLFFHMLWYHFEAGQDSASSRADERILRLQSAIFSFQSELKFSSIYKSNLSNFQVNWNWESRFYFNHHVVFSLWSATDFCWLLYLSKLLWWLWDLCKEIMQTLCSKHAVALDDIAKKNRFASNLDSVRRIIINLRANYHIWGGVHLACFT